MEVNGNRVTSHIVKGLVLAVVLILYAIACDLTHTSYANWFVRVWVLILLIGVISGVLTYASQLKGRVNFSQLMVHGLKMTAVVTSIYFLFSLLEIYLFFPGYLDEMVKQGLAEAAKQGKIDQEKLAENRDQMRKVVAVTLMAGRVMGTMVMGLLASLAGSALAKKNAG